uniref:WAP domain-containing protein n=1 Tax=Gouania willdenowi TaxID=441366 RepID=A0A8C5DBK4_GOUWI
VITKAFYKPGTCPRALLHSSSSLCHKWKKCDNDYDCPGEEKCCKTRCGHKCTNLGKGDIQTISSYVDLGVVSCCFFYPRPCLLFFDIRFFYPSDKPGTCPRALLHSSASLCHDWKKCDCDYECPRKEKCCNTHCGHKCTNLHEEKAGSCPIKDPESTLLHCVSVNKCTYDLECNGSDKCCSFRCGTESNMPDF